MTIISIIICLIITFLSLDIMYKIQDWYATKEIKNINKRRKRDYELNGSIGEFKEAPSLKSKITSIAIFLAMIFSWVLAVFTFKIDFSISNFFTALYSLYLYYFLTLLAYLNFKIFFTRIYKIYKQFKGEL